MQESTFSTCESACPEKSPTSRKEGCGVKQLPLSITPERGTLSQNITIFLKAPCRDMRHRCPTYQTSSSPGKRNSGIPKGQRAPNPPEFAQPRLSRVKARSSPAGGYEFGCVCSYTVWSLPRHPHDRPYRNKHTQIRTPSLGTTAL